MDVDDHAEELASDLGVDKSEVKEQLETLLEYSVPVDEAKGSIRRQHTGGSEGPEPEPTPVGKITPDSGPVTVTARVLTVGTRSIRYQGETQVIREGKLADGTGTISYTAWEDFGLEPGDSIRIAAASVREWEGEAELNVGGNSTVTATDPVAVPNGVEVGGERSLDGLDIGDRGRTVEVRVLESETRTIDGRDGETTIRSGVVGDETARLPFTDWECRDSLTEGSTLRLGDIYVREFRGVPQVNLTEFTTVEPIDRTIAVPESAPRRPIADAVAGGGEFDIAVVGTVVAVRDGSGLIERCPDCGRVAQNGQCRAHGEVDTEDDLRVKAIVDDGTDTVTAVLDADLTAAVYGGDLEAARAAASEAMDRSVVAESIREAIVGRTYRVRGNLSVDDYGANLTATAFDPVEADPESEARDLLAALREGREVTA